MDHARPMSVVEDMAGLAIMMTMTGFVALVSDQEMRKHE